MLHRTLLSIALLASGSFAQQNLNLPDNHHLSESPVQLANVGSALWWRAAAGRFQIVYDASNFTGSSGVTSPLFITKLRFRGEDAEINLGGQVYANVNVTLGSTTLSSASLSTQFAFNLAPPLPDSTTMGLTATTNVTLLPSQGSVPNNWCIEIDLLTLGNAINYDPFGPEPNLLIDIEMPTAPSNAPPLGLMLIQNTVGTPAEIRGTGVTALGAGALSGTLNPNPPVVGLEMFGTGGFTTLVPARNEFYGAGCGGAAASFYQSFLNGQQWNQSPGLVLTPDNPTAPTRYTVTPAVNPFDPSKINATANSTADDALVSHPLGFTLAYPGGSTSTVVASTNGFVWLDPAMTDAQFAPVVTRLLGDGVTGTTHSGPRFAPYWHDLNCARNLTINPAAGLHVLTDTSGGPGNAVAYVTWRDISEFNVVSGPGIAGHAVWNFQCVMYEATGVVEFRYGSMPVFVGASTATANSNAAIVGFSPGRIGGFSGTNSADPQSRDLGVELPFTTAVEGGLGNIGITAIASPIVGGPQYGGRMFPGQSVTWNVNNVPASALVGATIIDLAASRPGLQLPTIIAPGCLISTSVNALVWETFVAPGGGVVGAVPFVVPSGFDGVEVYAQFIVLDGLFGGPDLITQSSNAIRHVLGQN